MAENSGIEWTHHTWNPWVGCTKISPACDHCYAESWSKRAGRDVWGPHADRQRTKTQGNPLKWNKKLEGTGRRERVFVASLADVFDNHKSIQIEWRRSMWHTIEQCQNLDFLLLTKRPQNIDRYLPNPQRYGLTDWGNGWRNVWLGTTVEDQLEWDRRWPRLAEVPSQIRFISAEPLLGPIEMHGAGHLHWLITGGESGPNYRPANPDWFRSLRDQCEALDVEFLFKQWEGKTQLQIKALGRELDGVIHDGYPGEPI